MSKEALQLLLGYLLLVNLAAFSLMGLDKRRARRDQWRISEKTLFLPAVLGGSLGAIAGTLPMTIFLFGSFPLLAPLANVVVVPLIQPALILCLLFTATAAVPFLGPVAALFGLLADWTLSAVCWVVKLFALGPIVYFSGEEWYAKAIALLFLGFLFFCLWSLLNRLCSLLIGVE